MAECKLVIMILFMVIILLLFALFGIAVGNDIKLFLVPVMSLIYSIIGFVSGCLISFIYNLIAKKIYSLSK